jgi:hypothetical protein
MDHVAIYTNQIAFIICALFGGFAHYLKKYLRKETDVSLFDWYGSANLASTLYTVIIFVFTMIGALAGDIVNAQTGFWACLYTGFVTGFAIDAGFNSDAKISDALKEAREESRVMKTKSVDGDDVPVRMPRTDSPDIVLPKGK